MKESNHKAIAIVGAGAVMPDAVDLPSFWKNIKEGKYSITDVPRDRWNADLYYDEDRKAPDKTYSKIGGWVKEDNWDPMRWKLPIPPKVSAQMDLTQKWAITAAREALLDFDYLNKDFNRDRTAVILGVAMGGDQHLYSASRIFFPEYAEMLKKSDHFSSLPGDMRKTIIEEMRSGLDGFFPDITEDTMPGELSNIVAGRIAALFNFHGPNYIADAACASAMAGITAAIEGLEENDYDLVVTGGIDANMSPSTFVKFCKIGALSATGTRPYAEGADGFIMGEGAAVFVLKRLEDAERDGDKIYAVIRSTGGSSDGKGKGITAPNPIGQKFAVQRAWENSGVSPNSVSMIEGHGTSTSVGDAVELQCLYDIFGNLNMPIGSISLGSVKSNIGHLKGAAGAAGIMKAAMALHEKVIPPSLNFHKPNPRFDFSKSPLRVNTELRPWDTYNGTPRRCGVSAFGFGGTNFHIVMEEYIPNRITSEQKLQLQVSIEKEKEQAKTLKSPLRGAFVVGRDSKESLITNLKEIQLKVQKGWIPPVEAPKQSDLSAPNRIVIDYGNSEEFIKKIDKAIKGLNAQDKGIWHPLNANGIYFGSGSVPKTAFLFTGQGSQYINMLKELKETEPIVAQTFAEADQVMSPILGKPLTEYIFCDQGDKIKIELANENLKQTEITQPAVLTVDIALYRLMESYGVSPDYVMGHSLGEYGALVASKAISFANALKAVSARGSEMAKVEVKDKGAMVAVFGSPDKINEIIKDIDGYIEIANYNSYGQSVIGGATDSVKEAIDLFKKAGVHVAQLPVSHAFHTKIVAPASKQLGKVLAKCELQPPTIPIIANVTGDFYPSSTGVVPKMIQLLADQVASPVQFVNGINKLYDQGVRIFIEMGPKKALQGFVRDIMANKDDVLNLSTNHPKVGDIQSFNLGLCGMYSAGIGNGQIDTDVHVQDQTQAVKSESRSLQISPSAPSTSHPVIDSPSLAMSKSLEEDKYMQLGKLFVDFMDKANSVYAGDQTARPLHKIWITGAAVGLPKVDGVFGDSNVQKLLRGDQFIGSIPTKFQQSMLDKNITRLVKTGKSGPRFETISEIDEVIKLAARKNNLDIGRDFGFPQSRIPAIDSVTQLAIGAGIDALRDAGIPLVMHYKKTTTGSKLPDRWLLPDQMKDDTGIIFASAFPGYNAYAKEMKEFYEHKSLEEQLSLLQSIQLNLRSQNGNTKLLDDVNSRIIELQNKLENQPYTFNRRFLLRVLAMGHSQFAEYIGARGPNTQINAACASTTMAVGMAKDWIDSGRCNRVIIIAGDDITSEETIEWFSSGFLAVGAAATDANVEDAALPFDKRRHGMIVGMGGAAIVVESDQSALQRGLNPICEVLGTASGNSAFHGTRLDVNHIRMVMEKLISDAERNWGIDRMEIADKTVFVSHETYTPARGGSASAEINALRYVFKSAADKIIIANTKGMTGHAMAVGIEDVLAIKSLETGIVPPVPNFKEVDPELGKLNLSKGGDYPIQYALRLGAGFGSQISMTLLRWNPINQGQRPQPSQLGYEYRIANQSNWTKWIKQISNNSLPELEVVKRTLRVKDPLGDVIDAGNNEEMQREVEKPVQESPKPSVAEVQVADTSKGAQDVVQNKVLELISANTGYPIDMLNPELDLEADLGIDTVKQAELFADIRNEYGIERDESLQLSEFPTLNHIIRFVYDKRPDLAEAKTPVAAQPGLVSVPAALDAPIVETKPVIGDSVKNTILALISEKTGYPMDMLEPDLDLEADLGIDTVKQAELFADIRNEYGIERDETLQLSEFPTLNHIIQFVYDKRPDLVATKPDTKAQPEPVSAPIAVEAPPVEPKSEEGSVKTTILALISEKTGYPVDMLEPDLDLEADLGIDTVKQAELFADIRNEYGIERDETLQLSEFPTLNHIIQFVYDKRPDLVATKPDTKAQPEPVSAPIEVEAPSVEPKSEEDSVKTTILALISEKTGYPVDMLEPDLDLEADLGIDTVKQAELFADIRNEYGIERDETLQLSEFPTLNHIIQFVYDKRPDLVATKPDTKAQPEPVSAPIEVEAPSVEPKSEEDSVKTTILVLISEKTGYPVDMLEPDLDLEADLGIDTVKQAELFADIRNEYAIERDETLELSEFPTLNHIIQFVYDKRPDLVATKPDTTIQPEPVSAPIGVEAPPVEPKSEEGSVRTTILALISEKTGYPVDMLEPDLDLEADLGIDTVKQAELFAEIRNEYGIERDENLELAEFPTINHIVQFVMDKLSTIQSTQDVKVEEQGPSDVEDLQMKNFELLEQIPRRIPTPQLRPNLDFCKRTNVSLARNDKVIVYEDEGGVGTALIKKLEQKGIQVFRIEGKHSETEISDLIRNWTAESPIKGVYWLPALDDDGNIFKLKVKDWKELTSRKVKLFFSVMRNLILVGNEELFLISATRMGGHFGYDDQGALIPIGGAISGFTKAFKREFPSNQIKVIDFEKSRKTSAFAKILIQETLYDPGVVEVGYKKERRWTIGLTEHPLPEEPKGIELNKDSTFIVTGAAGSISSAITTDLAIASGGTFYLMDLIPKPDPTNPDILRFNDDKEGLQREIFQRLKEAGQKATPVMVNKEMAAIERQALALGTIQSIEKAGGKAYYISTNLLDNKEVASTIKKIKKSSKKIDVLLHAGGIEISHLIKDKTQQEFDTVFDIKADGWYNLLSALDDFPLGTTVAFSSIAGRFGNGGQTDYSAANDFLCKSSSSFKNSKPATVGLALDWTAWRDIGMAARGSIPTVMKQAGIDMLPPEIGIPFIGKELTFSNSNREIVVALGLGVMLDEFDENGGLDIVKGSTLESRIRESNQLMVQAVSGMGIYSGLVTSAVFDPKKQGFLFDHKINNTPVLPGVMGLEAMVEAACILFPDMYIKSIRNVEFMAPFKFYRSEPREIFVKVFFQQQGYQIVASCELFGSRKLHGQEEEEVKTHFRAEILLTGEPAQTTPLIDETLFAAPKQPITESDSIYKLYFHGPAYQVIEKAWKKEDKLFGLFSNTLPPNHSPKGVELLSMPRLIELGFQTAGLWEMGTVSKMGLPSHIDQIQIYARPQNKRTRLYAVITDEGGSFNAKIVDKKGRIYLDIKGYFTAEFQSGINGELVLPLQELMQ